MATALQLTWYADLKAESDLTLMAVAWDVQSIPFAKLDLKESQVNGARLRDAIREHKVEDYMQGFRNGDTFPRPVVHKTPTGYVILSGNQRMEAIRRLIASGELPKDTKIEVYVIQTDDKLLIEGFSRSANVAHGEGDSKEERIAQAMYCVEKLGMTPKNVAKLFLISQSAIGYNTRAENMRRQLEKAGVKTAHLVAGVLEPLAKLDYDEPMQHKLGQLVSVHQPVMERVRQVVGAISKQPTSEARLEKLREFEKELTVAAHRQNGHHGGATKVLDRPRLMKAVGMLQRLSSFLDSGNGGEPFSTLDELQCSTNADREQIVKLCKKLRYRLGVLAK